jgi:hypothetical protein
MIIKFYLSIKIMKTGSIQKILIFGHVITRFEPNPVVLVLTVMPRPQVLLKHKKIVSI